MALFTGPDNSLFSVSYEFSRIFKALVAFSKKLFNSFDIKWYCFVFIYKSDFVCNFWFFRKKMLNSFPECFIVTYFWRIKITEKLLAFFFIQPAAIISCPFFNDSSVFFLNKSFVNLTFSLKILLHMRNDLFLLPFA